MKNKLTEDQLLELKDYRLSPRMDVGKYMNTEDFTDYDKMAAFLEQATKDIDSPSCKVTASIFLKRYAFLAVISLYAFSALDKKMKLSEKNIWMEKNTRGTQWLPKFFFSSLQTDDVYDANRQMIRSALLKSLFAENMNKIISVLQKVSGISEVILWENIAVYLFWLYESVLKEDRFSCRKTTIQEDFHYLFHEAEGSLFGNYEDNPLTKYHDKKVFAEDFNEEVRVRKSCCYAYKLKSSSKRCKTCPCRLIKDNCLSDSAFCAPSAFEDYQIAFSQIKGT